MTTKGTKCIRCNKLVTTNDKYENFEGKIYHNDCFVCSHVNCGKKLTIENVKGFKTMPYCIRHVPNGPLLRLPNIIDDNNKREELFDSFSDNEYEEVLCSNDIIETEKLICEPNVRKEMRTILQESSSHMVDEIFSGLSNDMHIIVCGSPRVGKSTLVNAICGREVAKAREGLASVTHTINCYTIEGECNTGSDIINYKYNFWDTPGFESWDKDNIKTKVKEIIDIPETKPLCMIFCASPGTFVDLTRLEWLLNLCINKKHIFCALVCTNKYAGQVKSRRAVLDDFNRLLSKYIDDQPRKENDITFYGNIGLCTAVNSEPYEDDDRILPICGINELIYGIMESLVDEHVLKWCFIVLENQGFWNDCQQKVSGLLDGFKGKMKTLKKFLDRINKHKVNISKVSHSTK